MSSDDRKSIENGIWLCQSCAKLIDSDVGKYLVAVLHQWKQQAEELASDELLGKPPRGGKRRPSREVIEGILRRYCEDRVKEWDEARSDPHDPDKLTHYVEPHYSLLEQGLRPVEASSTAGRGGGESEKRDDPYQPAAEKGNDAITELVKLLNASKHLCITEDAGAGKSIFTRRLLAFLCSPEGQQALFEGKPSLVVRWEERVRSWPKSFDDDGMITALAKAVKPTVEASGADVSPAEVADWAIRGRRVFLILDALDQVPNKQSVASLEESLHAGPAKNIPIVLTSRAYAVTDHATLFHETSGWRLGRIDAFDKQQQETYLAGLYEGGLEALFPNYCEAEQLLRIPVVLAMIRELAEAGKLKAFHTRGDLYLQVHEHLTARAARKLGLQPDSDQLVRWCEILAATACEMMVRGVYNYAVRGSFAVRDIHQGASRRCQHPITSEEWHVIESVSGLTDRCILEGASRESLCWKHRGMMEFYCGLHLARNRQDGWCVEETNPRGRKHRRVRDVVVALLQRREDASLGRGCYVRCGDNDVRRHANDKEWYWAWRFSIEMAPTVWQSQPSTLLASLAELFERPASGKRPNELIYRAWSLMEGSQSYTRKLPDGQLVIQRFQQEFRDLLAERNKVAVGLQKSFVRCPPEKLRIDNQPYLMGTSEEASWGSDYERPQHGVAVSPFYLQSTPVTREQYRLYDSEQERADGNLTFDLILEFAPVDRCPMIVVSWYDSFAFARWIGGRLPTETEWEYACRSGTESAWCCGNDEKRLGHFAWYGANAPLTTRPVRKRRPNLWGLYDMHGNVWEWCQDWIRYCGGAPQFDPQGPEGVPFRALRGGFFGSDATSCRSAARNLGNPNSRGQFTGFRVARSLFGRQVLADASHHASSGRPT